MTFKWATLLDLVDLDFLIEFGAQKITDTIKNPNSASAKKLIPAIKILDAVVRDAKAKLNIT